MNLFAKNCISLLRGKFMMENAYQNPSLEVFWLLEKFWLRQKKICSVVALALTFCAFFHFLEESQFQILTIFYAFSKKGWFVRFYFIIIIFFILSFGRQWFSSKWKLLFTVAFSIEYVLWMYTGVEIVSRSGGMKRLCKSLKSKCRARERHSVGSRGLRWKTSVGSGGQSPWNLQGFTAFSVQNTV